MSRLQSPTVIDKSSGARNSTHKRALPFNFNVQHYTAHDLEVARHPYELHKRDEVVLRLDAAAHGLGTGSMCIEETL